MKISFFHGTNQFVARSLAANRNIQVRMGGGELGMGFYLGVDPGLAATWAQGRHGMTTHSVLVVEIEDSDFFTLQGYQISTIAQVNNIWSQLKLNGTERTHIFGFDYVVSPFAAIQFAQQYKFESIAAQNILNHTNTNINHHP